MLKNAQENRDKMIDEANSTYIGITNKVKEEYPEVAKTIDFENGRAMNSFQAFCVTCSNKTDELIKGLKGKFNEFKDRFKPIKDWWNNQIAPWFTWEKWKKLGQNAVDGVKNSFSNMKLSFKLPHFTWTSTPASGWISKVLSALNLPTSLPKLNVSWYKNGGVFGSDSIIGVGEYAGAKSNPEIVAPKSMIYDANIQAINDSNRKQNNYTNSNSSVIRKKVELEIDITSGGVRLGKKILDLVLDANDFYDLGLI